MFRVIAITMDATRMEKMKSIWPGVEEFKGIYSPLPYLGCNLAHIAAVREGLKNGESHVLILEDDARPKSCAEDVYSLCRKAMETEGWDLLSLCAASDYKMPSKPVVARQFLNGIYKFEPNRQFVNADAILWSRSALPLLDEFEAIIKDGTNFLPIDLMIYGNQWSIEVEGSEPCQIKHLREINGEKYWPPSLHWNNPRIIIAWPPLTYQSTEYISLHTQNRTPDYSDHNLKQEVLLRIDSTTNDPRALDFKIGSFRRKVTENELSCG